MSKFQGTKTIKGGSENGVLVFNTGPGTYHFSHDSLRQKMSLHRGIDHSEKLNEMRLYKVPLVEWQLPSCFSPSVCRDRFIFLVVVH